MVIFMSTRSPFTNLAVAVQVSVAQYLSTTRDGDGTVSRYSRLSIYLSTNYVACKGGHILRNDNIILSEFTGPAESNDDDIVKVPPLP
jgi:hypothetical protein